MKILPIPKNGITFAVPNGRFMNDSREHILTVAFKLFLQKSFKEVTMKEIVEKTGLSKGAFYHYFDSKEQLFLEILDFFFKDLMQGNFSNYSHESLWQFCQDYLDDILKKMQLSVLETDEMNANFFLLIFDAIKIIPGFRKLIYKQQEEEYHSWLKIVKIARKKGEINPEMTDEQVAKFFIYSNDGVGIRLMLDGSIKKTRDELQDLWTGFYAQLKR
jgi:TetR/AcrR family transcriptional repressor of nem operon